MGEKTISDLITSKSFFHYGKVNMIAADVSAGKTYFATQVLPQWTEGKKILYLIDTSNGEMRQLKRDKTIPRNMLSYADYGESWGEYENASPVMTYAGFGAELLKNKPEFHWHDYDYIVCDEMQNLVKYQNIPVREEQGNKVPSSNTENERPYLKAAENAIRILLQECRTIVIGMSATPQAVEERFKKYYRVVPIDYSQLHSLKTIRSLPYTCSIESLLEKHKGQIGILYVTAVKDMIRYIDYANSIGIAANGFWSIHHKKQMTVEQLALQKTVVCDERIPPDIDLLVINAASETSIKIQSSQQRTVDYMIIHNRNKDVITQVRGRYHGELPIMYYHDITEANKYACEDLPEEFLEVRLYSDGQQKLLNFLQLRNPKGGSYHMRTAATLLKKSGYHVEHKKDSKRGGQHYYIIHNKPWEPAE